ncbi:MAG: DNA replication terminus site-binding protein, partial [Phycisphaerales bacterium]|nr:DNA replication terminus site-binding protein [Phycisphaerales bacterium]
QRIETPQIRQELDRLAGIPADEMLARVRSVCPHLRANIVFADDEGTGVRRRLMQVPLPILIPLRGGENLPEFVAITPEPVGGPRLRRADVRIEDEPFLSSIRVHRYRCAYR